MSDDIRDVVERALAASDKAAADDNLGASLSATQELEARGEEWLRSLLTALREADTQAEGLRAELFKAKVALAIIDDFAPSSALINALPAGLRSYIHQLEARCDPAGDVQELALARDTINGLRSEVSDWRQAVDTNVETMKLLHDRAEAAELRVTRLAALIENMDPCEKQCAKLLELGMSALEAPDTQPAAQKETKA